VVNRLCATVAGASCFLAVVGIVDVAVGAPPTAGAEAPVAGGVVSRASVAARCAGVRATLVGTPGSDTLVGTPGRDVIVAGAGWDTVRGRGGRDVICGGAGADDLDGGRGGDVILGGRGGVVDDRSGRHLNNDVLTGGRGNDRIVGGRDSRKLPSPIPDLVDYSGANRGVQVNLARGRARGEGRDRLSEQRWGVVGSDHGDRIVGSGRAEYIAAGLGADYIDGGAGADILVADVQSKADDSTADVVMGGRGPDFLSSWGGDDQQSGGPGADQLSDWGASADVLKGQGGDDWITDTLVPGAGQVLLGGAGRNRLDLWTATIAGQPDPPTGSMDLRDGTTTLSWSPDAVRTSDFATVRLPDGVWTVYGTGAAERFLDGLAGQRTIHARGGDDYLGGTVGDDLLDGGQGTDSASPGDGSDTCIDDEIIVDGQTCEA
jgi:Ca2+-binding RTX toxin-like protein